MRHSRLGRGLIAVMLFAVILPLTFVPGEHRADAVGQPGAIIHDRTPGHGSSDFQNLNGFMWFYNTYFGYKYKDITKDLDHLKRSGIRVLGFFSPYHGDVNSCLGCDPLDYYSVSPQNGTLQDWKELVAAAHREDMKVVAYFVNIYMDSQSQFFKTAEQQYARGDRTSREVSSFRWTTNPADPLPTLRMGPPSASSWEYSPTAGAYYWKLWFGPGFDFDLPGSVAEVARIEKFWLDTGIDGFMWDVGRTDARFKSSAVELPKSYTSNDKWLTFEISNSANAAAYKDFGLTSWFNYKDDFGNTINDYTRVVNGAIDANGLEAALKNSDYARSVGATTYAWSISGDDLETNLIPHTYPSYSDDEVMRVQEAALLAGSGILYGSFMYDQYIHWSPTLRTNWEKVLRAVNDNKALLPSASRVRVPAGSDPEVYAMRRTSEGGEQTALLVYNFNNTATNVTVDLTNTGITTKQKPRDLYNGGKAPAIGGTSYTVSLPAHGFAMLEVKTS
ncbi:MAG TPA: alpha-amylase family glycosyl hydrolase [Kribbella sp.]